MTDNSMGSSSGKELAFLHERLERRFAQSRDERRAIGAPVFALEHGLSKPELALLKGAVGSAIGGGRIPRESWLPLVVYAAEVGYDYSGDEYWQTFEAWTPGWAEHGDRVYIRERFSKFKEAFGGAQPSGPWARHFSIICWPITHAVLPTDLQRHLVRLLYEYRRALTSDLLDDPAELGRHLAARSWHTSSRFQNFAQNTALLGRVAAALLVGEGERSPYLLDTTLDRIVRDLSEKRDARRWLHDAKSSAARVRTRGFRQGGESRAALSGEGAQAVADPDLSLREDPSGWTAYLEMPDLSVLAERFPEVAQELSHRRARVAGVSGPLSRGRLFYPGQQLRLSEWPHTGSPLLQVEGGTDTTNNLLSDQCVLSPGPRWVFRIRDRGLASEVRGNHVRPERDYVLLSEYELPADLPSWISETASGTSGVRAYKVEVPTVLAAEHLDALRAIGLGAVTDVEVRPAALVPAMWDGEGRAEWLAGEHPVLAVSSSRAVAEAIWTLDGDPSLIAWPRNERQIFVRVDELDVGRHELRVSLASPDGEEPMAEGAFEIRIRAPHARPPSGTFKEGLMILATPVNPTLTELWDGRAVIEVRGPAAVSVDVAAMLKDRFGSTLARRHCETPLPLASTDWTRLFEHLVRQDQTVQDVYDEAEACEIRVWHENLGSVTLRCEREFEPLRWVAGRDGDGPFLRLVDNSEGADIRVELFEFARPDRPLKRHADGRSRLRSPSGGLVTAQAGTQAAAMILPPTVRRLDDLRLEPRLAQSTRSLDGVIALIGLADRWATASLPADPFAERGRFRVLRAITGHIAGLVGGRHWQHLERRMGDVRGSVGQADLEAGVGRKPHQRALARDVGRWTDGLSRVRPEERVWSLATALATHARSDTFRSEDPRFAEFLLRLASAPESLGGWPSGELRGYGERALKAPVLIRAARLLVVAIDARDTTGVPATFGGWAWQ